jgi:hypothetical protein
MREIERKASDKLKDFISRVGKKLSEAESNVSGGVGRSANKMASGVENLAERLKSKPKQQGPSHSQADMDKAMEVWKTQGMGKIGNKPNFGKGYRNPDYYTSDHLSKMTKGNRDYITKSDDPYTMMKYGEMSKKILKQNYVEKRKPYTGAEKQLGRDLRDAAMFGGLTGEAINYAMDSNESERKKATEPKHFMGKEIKSQQDAHNSWTKRKYGNQ